MACVLTVWASGCQTPQPNPGSPRPTNFAANTDVAAGEYTLVFPDYLELDVPGQSAWSGHFLIPPDGRITFRDGGTLLLEGATVSQVRQRVAELTQTTPERVTCRVTHARSRVVYVLGAVQGEPRAIPYTGPERVVDFLQRAGGLGSNADRNAITVTRRNVANGQQAETFRLDWEAIAQGDARSNVLLEPNDEVLVGERERPLLTKTLEDLLGR